LIGSLCPTLKKALKRPLPAADLTGAGLIVLRTEQMSEFILTSEVRSAQPLTRAEIEALARAASADIGYVEDDGRFSARDVTIDVRLQAQASEIARAVDKSDLRAQTAAYGHFGRSPDAGGFPWEAIKVSARAAVHA
jgi:S-adenosylmethionine synthetase